MNFILALSVLFGFAAKLTTVSGLINATAPTTMNATMNMTLDVSSSGCSGRLKVYNNIVESPGYPDNYPDNLDCYFWVPIDQGKALKIVFYDFSLESHSNCRYDYLRIRNDMGFTYGKYCGALSGKIVQVTGSRASFLFHSDYSVQRRGFRLHFSTVSLATTVPPAPTTNPGCSPIVNNTLESPGYPSSYPGNLDCNISVAIPSGAEMRIFFQAFYLPYSSYGWCWHDYLVISNENGDNSGTYCGSLAGTTAVVNGTTVVLTFHSDHRNNGGRFRLLFTPIYPTTTPPSTQPPATTAYPACPEVVNNTLESPGYPSYYTRNMDCNISFPIPLGANMRIFFQVFYIYRYRWSCWYYGYLEIMNESGDNLGKYCGHKNGEVVVVNGSLVVLRLRSGYHGSYGRFRLLFTPVYPTAPPSTQAPAPTTYPVCPQVVNNTMESPGYPSYYRDTMDCNISIPIPLGANMRIFFQDFNIPQYYWSCRFYGYLEIMNENGDSFGKYCGYRNGQAVVVNGSLVVLGFRSGYYGGSGRFRLLFTPVYPFPTSQPSSSQALPSQGPNAQSQLRNLIANLRDILVQMEYVVDNQLGGPSSGNFTKRDHIARINDAVKYVETALKRAGQQKRNLDTVPTFEQLKKKAAEVITKMEDKEGQFKKRAQLRPPKAKRRLEERKLMKNRVESIPKNLLEEEKKAL